MLTLFSREFWNQNLEPFSRKKAKKTSWAFRFGLDRGGYFMPWFEEPSNHWLLKKIFHRVYSDPSFAPKGYTVSSLELDDKVREIFKLNFLDYLICKGLAEALHRALESQYSHSLYSFRKGLSNHALLKDLSARIREHPGNRLYLFKADISQYDQAIRHSVVLAQVEKRVPSISRREAELLRLFLRAEAHDSRQNADKPPFCLLRGLPTGTPIVPVLENLYLLDLDDELLCTSPMFYGRYGDDLIYLDPDKTKVLHAMKAIESYVEHHGLSIKPEKRSQICLLTPGAEGENGVSHDFKPEIAFDHLGMTVKGTGFLGLPLRKARILRSALRIEMDAISRRMPDVFREENARARFFSKSIVYYLRDPHLSPSCMADLMHGVNDLKELREWDIYLKQLVLKNLFGGFSKKNFRKVDRGFFHRRFFSFVHHYRMKQKRGMQVGDRQAPA